MDSSDNSQPTHERCQGCFFQQKCIQFKLQYLASLTGWNLVVVADLKTPKNWKWEGVHLLSVEVQEEMSKGAIAL